MTEKRDKVKSILVCIFLLVFAFSFCKADDSAEVHRGVKVLKNLDNSNYILCIDGYQWLKFNGHAPQQMFEIHRYRTSVEVVSVPVSCN